jgi:hypothetical protein
MEFTVSKGNSAPQKPVTENLAPTISMRFPYADNTYTNTSPFGITLIANADDPTALSPKLDSTAAS